MKVLVFPHHLEIGGSQVNAIDLAAAVRDLHGHDVVLLATPGPAGELVRERGLRLLEAPRPRVHPSPAMMSSLRRVVAEERIDLVHAWDWPQCLDAFYGVHALGGVPLVGSNMAMAVTTFLPRSFPLTYGTPQLVEQARARRAGPVALLEPPVDALRNAPGAAPSGPFKARHGLDDGVPNLVIVSRLVAWLKLEGILATMGAVEEMDKELPCRLVIVGGGPAEARLEEEAATINARLGRRAVVLVGPLTDPRPAYEAADLVVGMGSSLLRGMAFAKPCLVLGERGFSMPFTPKTSASILWTGFYGKGDGSWSRLGDHLQALLADPAQLASLGTFGRRLVESRFSLEMGAASLDRLYRQAATAPHSSRAAMAEAVRSGAYRLAAAAVPTGWRRRLAAAARGGRARVRRSAGGYPTRSSPTRPADPPAT